MYGARSVGVLSSVLQVMGLEPLEELDEQSHFRYGGMYSIKEFLRRVERW